MHIDSQVQYNDEQIAHRHTLYFHSELALFLHLKSPHLLTDNFLASNWSLLTAMHKLYKEKTNVFSNLASRVHFKDTPHFWRRINNSNRWF